MTRHEIKDRVQLEALHTWALRRRGTFAWATGCGKSKAAIEVVKYIEYSYPKARGLWVFPTESMRDIDWPAEFEQWEYVPTGKMICYASLSKEKLSDYDYIIYDECHRLTLSNLHKLAAWLDSQTNPMVLGLTATFPKIKYETDKERVEALTDLLPPVHTITLDEAVDMGLIADFEIIVLKFFLDAVNLNIPGGSKAKPFKTTEAKQYLYLSRNVQLAMIKNNDALKFSVISKRTQFMYNLPSKFRLAKKCLTEMLKDDKRTLVFSGAIERINLLCPGNVYHSESDYSALNSFQAGESSLLGSIKALNEGKNLYRPEQALVDQLDSQERNLVQRVNIPALFKFF